MINGSNALDNITQCHIIREQPHDHFFDQERSTTFARKTRPSPGMIFESFRSWLLDILILSVIGSFILLSLNVIWNRQSQLTSHDYNCQEVEVREGDTLWLIAGRYYPGKDRRLIVARILKINNLSSSDITEGQSLLLPLNTSHPSSPR